MLSVLQVDPQLTLLVAAAAKLVLAVATLVVVLRQSRKTDQIHHRVNGPLDQVASRLERMERRDQKPPEGR